MQRTIDKHLENLILQIFEAKAVAIRDVDGGEKPFLYSSGNYGPGYVMIKGLVGWKSIFKPLLFRLANEVALKVPDIDFVVGNVSGGQVPGWVLSEYLEILLGRPVPFVYARGTRKKGGQQELLVGHKDNPNISKGSNGLIVEELVNFAETTTNSAEAVRDAGCVVTHAACILFYGNPESIKTLHNHSVEMIHLFTLEELLYVAAKHVTHSTEAISAYREFLANPLSWQEKRGLKPVLTGGTQ